MKHSTLEHCLSVLEQRNKNNWENTKPLVIEILTFVYSRLLKQGSSLASTASIKSIYDVLAEPDYRLNNRYSHKNAWDLGEKIIGFCDEVNSNPLQKRDSLI